jgi:hypothetical protein
LVCNNLADLLPSSPALAGCAGMVLFHRWL